MTMGGGWTEDVSFALGPTSGKKQAIIAVTVMFDYVPHLAFACMYHQR